jgi:hypothetical protein
LNEYFGVVELTLPHSSGKLSDTHFDFDRKSTCQPHTEIEKHSFINLELKSTYGPVCWEVSTKLPRKAKDTKIPLIDISRIHGEAYV